MLLLTLKGASVSSNSPSARTAAYVTALSLRKDVLLATTCQDLMVVEILKN